MLCGDDEDNYKSDMDGGRRRKGDSDWISGSSLIIHAKQGKIGKIYDKRFGFGVCYMKDQ